MMVQCKCGKPLELVPAWLAGIKVDFVCNNCPDRKTTSIAHVILESASEETKANSKAEKHTDDEAEDVIAEAIEPEEPEESDEQD